MSGSNIRNYQVNYAITAEGNATQFFIQMAENANKMQEPLNALQAQIKGISRSLQLLGRNENLKRLFALEPTVNLSALKTGLAEAEKLVSDSAARMASQLNTALANAASLRQTKAKSAVKQSKEEIQALMKDLENQFFKVSGGKKINDKSIKGKDDTTAEAWKVRSLYKKMQRDLNKMDKIPKSAATVLNSVKRAEDITKTAKAVQQLNESMSAFKHKKLTMTVDANITPAVEKVNTLLNTVRESVAAIPVTLGDSKGKKGKSISTVTGKSTKTGKTNIAIAESSNVTNLLKGKEKAVAVQTNFNSGDAVAQLNQSIAKLQELAKTKSIALRAIFNLDKAGFQLNQAIATLQKLADGKPIVLKATITAPTTTLPTAPATATPSNETATVAATTQTTTVKDGKGSTQAKESKWTGPTQSQINAWERHNQSMSDLRQNHIITNAQMQAKEAAAFMASQQEKYNTLFPAPSRKIPRWSKLSYKGWEEKFEKAENLKPIRSYRSGYDYSSRPAPSQNDFYSRSRAFWYPLTGNTSFGARTPMAVDMAKGMGTMFAIGGAMSAVGSSMHQAVEYQNIMKTTNAILKNGTDTYSNGAFKGMEQIVRQVGKDTKFTAPQVASAAKFLAMAGYDIPAINSAIKPVSNIALIGDTDLGATADKLTNVMTTFGIMPEKMNDIADIMTTTFTRSNTDMMMLAESAKYAGGIAHLYGGSFQNNFADVMAMFGVLGNAGIQASSAGTTLRMMYQNLMQPNKKQSATLKQYGIYTRDTKGNPLEMVDILKQIAAKVPANQLADAVGNMFRITAQPGAAALANSLKNGNNSSLLKLMEANRSAAGTGISESIANEKKNTVAGLWAQVTSTFTEGILQAFENREGGWAGMLARLRDYLAKPETVDMLKSIVDLVENLAGIMGDFAKAYAKVYSMFPGLINFWMKFQLSATQLGYLVTPIIQLVGALSMLKAAMLSTTAATTTTTIAETNAERARIGAGASAIASGFAPRYIRDEKSAAAFAAYTGAMSTLNDRKVYYERKANTLRNTVQTASGRREVISPLWFAPVGTFGNNPAESNAFFKERGHLAKYNMALQGKMLNRATSAASRVQSQMDAMKSQYFEALRAERRSSQIANSALVNRYKNRYSTLGGDAALFASVVAQRKAYDDRINAISSARHAARGTINSSVVNRYARTASWGKGAGLAWKNSFSAGQALGAISLAGMIGSIKGAFASLIGGLAKAIGLLTSPIGLVTLAIGTAATAIIVQINRIKKAQDQSDQKAKSNAEKAHQARIDAYKPIDDMNKKYRTIGDTLTPVEDTLQKSSAKEVRAKYLQYIDAFDTTATDSVAQKQWFADIINNRNATLAFGNHALSFKEGRKISGQRTFEGSINYMGDQIRADQLMMQQMDARNTNGANSRAWESLYLAGATNKQVVTAQQQIMQLREKLIAKKITQDAFNKKANEIRASVANPNANGLLNATDYTAQEIKNNTNWSRFVQYQQGGWNVLTAELNADIGTISGYLQGVNQLKNGVKQYSDQWWQAVARVYDGIKYPLEIAGETVDIVLNALPNGHIDTSRIIEQIQQMAENLQLNISDFANMASSIYGAMAKIGVVPGRYYSDFMKFTWSQVQHSDVTATEAGLYFDQYIAKGDKNATWGGMNRQQYIDYVQSSSGNKGRAAKERSLIRKTMSNKSAIKAKQQYDKTIRDAKDLTGKDDKVDGGSAKDQKDYKNTYDRSAAHPTQVIINIDNLARFDRTAIAGNSDERAIAEAIENKIAEAVAMISAQALNTAGSLISQGA